VRRPSTTSPQIVAPVITEAPAAAPRHGEHAEVELVPRRRTLGRAAPLQHRGRRRFYLHVGRAPAPVSTARHPQQRRLHIPLHHVQARLRVGRCGLARRRRPGRGRPVDGIDDPDAVAAVGERVLEDPAPAGRGAVRRRREALAAPAAEVGDALDDVGLEHCLLGVDVKVIITPPCMFCMENHE
jgi:hypothetical protein